MNMIYNFKDGSKITILDKVLEGDLLGYIKRYQETDETMSIQDADTQQSRSFKLSEVRSIEIVINP